MASPSPDTPPAAARTVGLVFGAVFFVLAVSVKVIARRNGAGEWWWGLAVASMMFSLAGVSVALFSAALASAGFLRKTLLGATALLPLLVAIRLIVDGVTLACGG